jgi:cellulose synthase/poly-beta-1,6-N-acetylglucosamine synthase-like glycosyltransferase
VTGWEAVLACAAGMEAWRWTRRPRPPSEGGRARAPAWPDVTVSFLVAAWNAADDIPGFLSAYAALSCPRRQLVLAVGGQDDGLEVARRWARQLALPVDLVVQTPGMGKQGALRAGWPLVAGDIVFLTDVDCRPSDDAVAPLVWRVASGADAATGAVRPLPDQVTAPMVRLQWAVRRAGERPHPHATGGLSGQTAALSRTILQRVGAFAWDAPTGTDYTLAKRVLAQGGIIWRHPESQMPTRFPTSWAVYVRKQARWIKNVAVHGLRYGAKRDVASAGATMAVPCAALMLAVAAWWWAPAWVILAWLVAEMAGRRRGYLWSMGHRAPLSVLAASVGADWGAALMALWQAISGGWQWT